MKKFVLVSILGIFSLAAMAQTASRDETVTISGAKEHVEQQRQPMSSADFNRFAGSYALSNGNSLALFCRGEKKYAALHGEVWHEIIATSSNSFVAKDHQLKMRIERNENGEVSGELYMAVTPQQLAAGTVSKLSFH